MRTRSARWSCVDASQAAPQLPIDLAAMADDERPDLLAFTGHKVVGPTGIGVLWGRREPCSTSCRRSSVAAR